MLTMLSNNPNLFIVSRPIEC